MEPDLQSLINDCESFFTKLNPAQDSLNEYLGESSPQKDEHHPSKYSNSMPSTHEGDTPLTDLDITINALKEHLLSFGFPECGNLKSAKKKDIKQTIKAFSAILKQRQKDIEFKNSVGAKMRRLEQDKETFEAKIKNIGQEKTQLEKEVYSL